MAEIHAGYRRTFQVRPYESETVELSITDEVADGPDLAKLAGHLHAQLAEVGDAVVLDRMGRTPQQRAPEASRADRDPWAPIPDATTGKEWRPQSGGSTP